MKHCPNPLCPHRVTQGSAALYEVESVGCEHCAATLSEGAAPASRTRTAPSTLEAPDGVFHRALVTLACLGAFVMANRGLVPGVRLLRIVPVYVRYSHPGQFFIDHALARLCLGFMLAGVASRLFASRRRLNVERAALWIAVGASVFFECFAYFPRGRAVPIVGVFEASYLFSLVALLGLARIITRQGLVNGVGALLGAWSLDAMYTEVLRVRPALAAPVLTPLSVVVWALSLVAIVALTAWTLRASKSMRARIVTTETSTDTAYRASSSRAIEVDAALRAPSSAGDAMMVFPFVSLAVLLACRLFGREAPSWFFAGPTNVGYCVTFLAVTLGCVAWFTRLLNPPSEVAGAIARATGVDASQAPVASARRALYKAIGASALFVAAVTALGWVQEIVTHGVLGDCARMGVLLTAVVLDAIDGFRAQSRFGSLVAVRSESRVYAAEITRALLEAHEIPAAVSSRHYRTLQPFLGTVSTIDVAVAASRGDDANSVLTDAQTPKGGGSDQSLN